jgi:putative SOS response-associated peptidase YedK
MCGRFVRNKDSDYYIEVLGVSDVPSLGPSFNVAPTQTILAAVCADGERKAVLTKFGMVAPWSASRPIPLLNARAETVATKPAFKKAFRSHRCLIAVDGYYEWRATGKQKQPYLFRMKGNSPFVFAGLYDNVGAAIITTEPNELQAKVHDRMPVILTKESSRVWMDPARSVDELTSLLVPFPSDAMTCIAVNSLVNAVKNNSPECLAPVA